MMPFVFIMPHCERQPDPRECYLAFANGIMAYRIQHARDKNVDDAYLRKLMLEALDRSTKAKGMPVKP